MSWDVTSAKRGMSCDKEELVLGRALGFNPLISFLYSIGNNKGIKGLFLICTACLENVLCLH